jgi:hypothetical protein
MKPFTAGTAVAASGADATVAAVHPAAAVVHAGTAPGSGPDAGSEPLPGNGRGRAANPFETPPGAPQTAWPTAWPRAMPGRARRGRGGSRDSRRGIWHHRTRRLVQRHRGRRLRRHPRNALGRQRLRQRRRRHRRAGPPRQRRIRCRTICARRSPACGWAGDDRAALEVLIESLDGDGYLADPLLEIAERLAEMLGVSTGEAATRCWTA